MLNQLCQVCAGAAGFDAAISQEKSALLAEVNHSYVGRVERGDNNVAGLTLKRLADALGITMTELMAEAQLYSGYSLC